VYQYIYAYINLHTHTEREIDTHSFTPTMQLDAQTEVRKTPQTVHTNVTNSLTHVRHHEVYIRKHEASHTPKTPRTVHTNVMNSLTHVEIEFMTRVADTH